MPRIKTLILFLIVCSFARSLGDSDKKKESRLEKGKDSEECCVSSKLNVAAKKANHGKDFLRNLTVNSEAYKLINPENMCHLMHFLIQQAKLNNKSVTFTKGSLKKKS